MRRIVVHLRTCPTRLLGPYGCEWTETPALNRLAAEGVVFDSHYATRIPTEIQSAVQAASHSYVSIGAKFDPESFSQSLRHISQQETGILTISIDPFSSPLAEWQSQQIDRDQEANRDVFFSTCEENVAAFDERLGILLETLSKHEVAQSALLVVTASSGLPLGEHGITGTAESRLHEELVHLPLIVRFPDRRLAGCRVAGYTTPDDLNENLEAMILGTQPARDSVVCQRENEVSIRTADSCLILPLGDNPNPPLLYDRPDDRFEVNNLADRQSDRVEELKSKILFTAEGAEDAEKKHNSSS